MHNIRGYCWDLCSILISIVDNIISGSAILIEGHEMDIEREKSLVLKELRDGGCD